MTIRILAVCLGNICRSPAAEAALREAAAAAGLPVEVDSAGTGRYHIGEPPHPEVRRAGAAVGLGIDGTARQVTRRDLDEFDLILAMDSSNRRDLVSLAPEHASKIHLFRELGDEGGDVPDPWGGSPADYEETVAIVRRSARGVIDALREGRL